MGADLSALVRESAIAAINRLFATQHKADLNQLNQLVGQSDIFVVVLILNNLGQ